MAHVHRRSFFLFFLQIHGWEWISHLFEYKRAITGLLYQEKDVSKFEIEI